MIFEVASNNYFGNASRLRMYLFDNTAEIVRQYFRNRKKNPAFHRKAGSGVAFFRFGNSKNGYYVCCDFDIYLSISEMSKFSFIFRAITCCVPKQTILSASGIQNVKMIIRGYYYVLTHLCANYSILFPFASYQVTVPHLVN